MRNTLQLTIFLILSTCTLSGYAISNFNWSEILVMPPPAKVVEAGNQILHFSSKNNHYSQSKAASAFVQTHFRTAKPLESDAEVLQFGSQAVRLDGAYLEMGVCTGKTVNFIAALNPHKTVHGFDSFEGLPEEWVRDDRSFPKGTFGFKVPFSPPVLHNVQLYKGWFSDVLPVFKATILHEAPIAFLHIDCDIYSSTRDILSLLADNIVAGTVIVFDEFYNYPGSERHEMKALQEFLEAKNLDVEYLAYNIYHEQVALRIR